MATKNQCKELAKKLGCEFAVEKDYVSLSAPSGFAFNDQTFAQHYADFAIERGGCKKSEAYEAIYQTLKSGVGPCECNACSSEAKGEQSC